MWVQVAVIVVGVLLVVYLLRGRRPSTISAGKKAGLVLLAVVMVVTVLNPELTTRVARILGVGRGADLLLYALSAAFVVYALSQYANRQSDRNTIHRLARRVALLEAREKFGDPPVPPRPTPEPGGEDEPHR